MNWQTMLVDGILFLGAGASGRLIWFAWKRRNFPGALPFAWLAASLTVWSLAYGLELAFPSLGAKTFWAKVQYLGISLTPVAWLLFALAYTGREEWLSHRRVIALLVIPGLTILAAFTNSWHGLQWASYTLDADNGLSTFRVISYGAWWLVHFSYSYLLLFGGTLALFLTLRTYSRLYQWQFVILLVGLLLPWIANVLYLTRLSPLPPLDPSPFAFIASILILWQGLYRFRLFDLIPIGGTPVLDRLDRAALVVDTQERLVDANPLACSWFHLSYQKALGKPVSQAWREWQQIDLSIANAVETNETISLVVAGVKRFYVLQITPIWNRRKRLTGRLILLRDVTADQLAEEALSLAQVKTEFLAKVSHELRTPLTSILGVSEMLCYGVYGPLSNEQKEALEIVFESTTRMNRLVNDLLEQARLEQGDFHLNRTEFSLAEQLEKLRSQMAPRAWAKGLELLFSLEPGLPEQVCGDPLRLYQILDNLVANAIKYTEAGSVGVRVYPLDKGRVAFEISDTGVGIPADVQGAIYDAFRQIRNGANGHNQGFGLGLSIVKQLVALMNGDIQLKSEVSKGSTFTVRLPLEFAKETAS